MRTLFRLIAAGALSVPLLAATAGIAAADSGAGRSTGIGFHQSNATAGPNGVARHAVWSGVDEAGNTYFYAVTLTAGPDSAGFISTLATANAHHGSVHFQQHQAQAGAYGVSSSLASSKAGG